MGTEHIRNFSIIAHIDHGKSTLADRLLELTDSISDRDRRDQMLDNMDLERERGITIKSSTATMSYEFEGKRYMLNLIDTPGHVDFHYEVSRSLAACEGALLIVDATQGIEAQTVANAYLAIGSNTELLGVINKIDLPAAQPDIVAEEMEHILGVKTNESFKISAKSGEGVKELLDAIVMLLPPPEDNSDQPCQAMVFDSTFDQYRGVICYIRVFAGSLKKKQQIKFMRVGKEYTISEIGKLSPAPEPLEELKTGEVGYLIGNIRQLADVRVGDTITDRNNPAEKPLSGYEPPVQMVFSDFYPGNNTEYDQLRSAFEKLTLNDASFTFSPRNSPALGFGFRCGFLGLLHMEIIQERLEREHNLEIVQTAPTVSYEIVTSEGETERIDSPSELPDMGEIETMREPFVRLEIITNTDSIGGIMKLAEDRRAETIKTDYLGPDRVMLEYKAPLAEIVYDFYDKIKGISHGYATMDYEMIGFEDSNLVKIDILVNKVPVDALSLIVHRDKAQQRGRNLIKKLKETIPKHNFEIPLQVAIGGKVIARETIRGFRKDVTEKLYGGDVSRKMKLLKKQKEGKKRMKNVGSVQIPQKAFMSILDNSE
jgi:GTP-binding protein LepA